MKRLLALLLLLAGPSLVGHLENTAAASKKDAPKRSERIARIEAGLRPATIIEGDPPWTLKMRMEHYGVPAVGIAVIENYKVAWFRV